MHNQQLILNPQFLSARERERALEYLLSLYPIWEERFSKSNPPPSGQEQRRLLRPVYWLGNWQFACLNYYHPPKGIENRCVQAEPFPEALQNFVDRIEALVKSSIPQRDVPSRWHLNTCLVNYYGDQIKEGRRLDCARVGEHKDFELGPVASVSFGERALFQFVESANKGGPSRVVLQQWLEDSSLQVFAGDRYKKKLFHRVQRVETRGGHQFQLRNIQDFETRRINLTFRYVPDEHVIPYKSLPAVLKDDIRPYMQSLAQNSQFFQRSLSELL